MLLALAFAPGVISWIVVLMRFPGGIGSDASVYTAAAAAWLHGTDPWAAGPPQAIFAGPPTLFLPYAPFVLLPDIVVRLGWVMLCAALAIASVRRLGLHVGWIAFTPLLQAILLGHVEVVVMALLVRGGALSGLAAVLKPYAALPLLAERRWRAFGVAALAVAISLPVLPWGQFVSEFGTISANLARQSQGDSVFGNPVLMVIAVVALASLGPRRALWLATPLLWPSAQPTYKAMTLPVLTPVVAAVWALPVPGATLAGVIIQASLERIDRARRLPPLLRAGIEPIATAERARWAAGAGVPVGVAGATAGAGVPA